MKTLGSYVSLLALGSIMGCSANVDTAAERTGSAAEGVTASGLTAAVTNLSVSGSSYTATVTISNQSKEPVTNWQIGIAFHTGSLIAGKTIGADETPVGIWTLFTPQLQGATIAPGASRSFTFKGNATGSDYAPTISTVNGVASGAVNAGNPADGIDPVARAVATAAVGVAYKYENDKLPNTGDGHYYMYSDLIWDSHSYRIASDDKTIEFDPNVPGYKFIPNSAKAELAFAQVDPSVASYMVAGLASCFAQVNYDLVYAFDTAALHDVTFPAGGSSQRTNADRSVDYFKTTSAPAKGGTEIKIVETSTTDENFGILTYTYERQYATSQDAIIAKYKWGDCGASSSVPATLANCPGQEAGCSPFNGPGGSSNPYLVISINGASVPARFNLSTPGDCSKGCTATAVIDPVAYATAGDYYDANGALVGPQVNPFTLNPTYLYATTDHQSQYGMNPYYQYGTFSKAVTFFGTTKYKYAVCGTSGSGC